MTASSLSGAGDAFDEGVSRAPFQMLASEDFFAKSGDAFAELWMAVADPVFTPLVDALQREGEWIMLLGYTFTRLSTIRGMMRTGASNGRSPLINWVCLMSFTGGVFYLLHRLGPTWPVSIAFWLYLMNIALTFIDLKMLNEFRTRERLSPVSAAKKRQHVRRAPAAADVAALVEPADDGGGLAMGGGEERTAAGQDQLHDRILALESHIAELRRERDVPAAEPVPAAIAGPVPAVAAAVAATESETNIFGPDDEIDLAAPAREPVKLQNAEVIIRNLARRTVYARAWKEIGLADEVGHEGVRGSLV